jgi:hypothetical protein
MLILGLYFETTGFDVQKDRITEVGAVLWDTVTSTPVRLVSTMVKHEDAPPILLNRAFVPPPQLFRFPLATQATDAAIIPVYISASPPSSASPTVAAL